MGIDFLENWDAKIVHICMRLDLLSSPKQRWEITNLVVPVLFFFENWNSENDLKIVDQRESEERRCWRFASEPRYIYICWTQSSLRISKTINLYSIIIFHLNSFPSLSELIDLKMFKTKYTLYFLKKKKKITVL